MCVLHVANVELGINEKHDFDSNLARFSFTDGLRFASTNLSTQSLDTRDQSFVALEIEHASSWVLSNFNPNVESFVRHNWYTQTSIHVCQQNSRMCFCRRNWVYMISVFLSFSFFFQPFSLDTAFVAFSYFPAFTCILLPKNI